MAYAWHHTRNANVPTTVIKGKNKKQPVSHMHRRNWASSMESCLLYMKMLHPCPLTSANSFPMTLWHQLKIYNLTKHNPMVFLNFMVPRTQNMAMAYFVIKKSPLLERQAECSSRSLILVYEHKQPSLSMKEGHSFHGEIFAWLWGGNNLA